MNTEKRYSPEVRERVVQMVLDSPGRARFAMGSDRFDRDEVRLYCGDVASLGAAGRSVIEACELASPPRSARSKSRP